MMRQSPLIVVPHNTYQAWPRGDSVFF